MIVMDVIVSWPRNNDYPLWRQFIRNNRARFNNIIIVFTETYHGEDYKQFVRDAMFQDFVLCVDSPLPSGDQDWRNVAVNFGLLQSIHAPWIWFTEQDFFPNDKFFDDMAELELAGMDVIATYDQTRMHPCNILIKRDALSMTRKDFGIEPGVLDHFGKLQKDVESLELKVGREPQDTYFHYNGLSHNWTLISDGQNPNYKPEEFDEYIRKCLNVSVPLNEKWLKIANRYMTTKSATPPPTINPSPKSPEL